MKPSFITRIVTILATFSILGGLFGMLFCFPFLWSSGVENIVGAGLPFVAGSILLGSGMITLGIIYKKES